MPTSSSLYNALLPDASPATPMERLVARDRPFSQSSNSLRIHHRLSRDLTNRTGCWWFGCWWIEDWFHVLLRLRTVVSISLFVIIWTTGLLFFAGLYYLVDQQHPNVACGLGKEGHPIQFSGAFAFSLETSTTVGYGIPNGGNGFFEHQCDELQVVIYFHMLFSMLFNAFLLSFLYARISRSESRGAQVLFSRKAVLNREILPNGIRRYMLSTRIYDMDSMYPLVEAHVRFYAVKHGTMHAEEHQGTSHPMKMEPMRVSMPNDDLGAVMYTSIPSTATHHIDYHSPILPPSKRRLGPEDGRIHEDSGFVMDPSGLNLRENDSYTGGQDGLRCVICGETYGTVANLIQHIRYNQHTEKHDEVPVRGSHQELDVDNIFKGKLQSLSHNGNSEAGDNTDETASCNGNEEPPPPWFNEHRGYLEQANVEIICVLEAVDPITSGTFQAIQSYTVDDIVFGDVDFAPCVMADRDVELKNHPWLRRFFLGHSGALGRSVKIDLNVFHDIVENKGGKLSPV